MRDIQDMRCSRLASLPVAALVASTFLLLYGHAALADDVLGRKKSFGARVLSETQILEITGESEAVYSFKRRIQILDERGQGFGLMHFQESEFARTQAASGRVYDASGNLIITRTKSDMEKLCGFRDYALYADICDYQLNLGAGDFPFTVEYEYRMKINSLFFWPDWSPQEEIPVDTSRYVLMVPIDVTFRTRESGNVREPTVVEQDGKKVYTWTVTDVPAFEAEPYMPPASLYKPGIEFAAENFKLGKFKIEETDWSVAGRSVNELMKGAFKLSSLQRQAVDSLFPSGIADLAGCARLHDFLRSRSRYVAISIGIGGWQPHSSDMTFAHGYGDCKDLSTMYASMLREVGGTAKPVLLMTSNVGRTNPDFPTLSFNHMILFFLNGSDTVWIDPTCFTCKLGDLPWQDENIYALALDSTGGTIVRTPASDAADNVITRKASLHLNDDLSLNATVEIHAVGNPGHDLRYGSKVLARTEFADQLKEYPMIINEVFSVKECKLDSAESDLSSIRLTVKGSIQRYARLVGDKLYLELSVLPLLSGPESLDLTHRKFPLEFRYPHTFVDTIAISVPDGYGFSEIPGDVTFSDEYGMYESSSRIDRGQAMITRHVTLAAYAVDTAAIAQYILHRGVLRQAIKQNLVVEKR
jgi:hypothetical protein